MSGITLPLLQTILVRAAGPTKTGRVLTLVMLVSTIAPIAGPLVGGSIIDAGSWRWVFVVNLPICATAIGLALRFVSSTPAQVERTLDLPGVLLLGIGTAALLYGLSNAADRGHDVSVRVGIPLAVEALLTAGFVRWSAARETRSAIPVRLLTHKAFGSATATLFLTGVALYGALFLIPLYLHQQRGLTALAAGAILALHGPWLAPDPMGRKRRRPYRSHAHSRRGHPAVRRGDHPSRDRDHPYQLGVAGDGIDRPRRRTQRRQHRHHGGSLHGANPR